MSPTSHPATLADLRFEPADPATHTELLHGWLRQPHVAPWWGPERDLEETGTYLRRQVDADHLVPWIVSHDGEPFGYVETYRAAEDPLAEAYPLDAGDRGWHVLVGPPHLLGSGLPRLMGRAVLARLFADPRVARVVCEPDDRNGRMLRFCRGLGYERLATLDLGHKQAALLACTRDSFTRRWPGDLAELAGPAEPGGTP